MIFCRKCGAQMDNTARFCVMCGNPLDDVTDDSVDKAKQKEQTSQENHMHGTVMDYYNAAGTKETLDKKNPDAKAGKAVHDKIDVLSVVLYVIGGLIIFCSIIAGSTVSSTMKSVSGSYNTYGSSMNMQNALYSSIYYQIYMYINGAVSGIIFIALGRIHAICLLYTSDAADE